MPVNSRQIRRLGIIVVAAVSVVAVSMFASEAATSGSTKPRSTDQFLEKSFLCRRSRGLVSVWRLRRLFRSWAW